LAVLTPYALINNRGHAETTINKARPEAKAFSKKFNI
jgi:hypothetical protein